MQDAATPVVWQDGGSEPIIWANIGHCWCAVWWQGSAFAAWVLGCERKVSSHPTESDAKLWCEAQMKTDMMTILHPSTKMTPEQRADQMWRVHPTDLDRLQMTRNAFYEAHIHAAIAQASVK